VTFKDESDLIDPRGQVPVDDQSEVEEEAEEDQSLIPTLPCPAGDPTRPTLPSIEVSTTRQNKTALTNEIVRLQQVLVHGYQNKAASKERMNIWVNLGICKSLLKNLKQMESRRKPRQ
jgi:hypothetical protein